MSEKFAMWLRTQPKGTLTRLMYETRLSWTTLARARTGKVGIRAALILHKATGGQVAVEALTDELEALDLEALGAQARARKRRPVRKRRTARAA